MQNHPLEALQDFRTAEEAHAVYCHQEFLQKIDKHRKGAVGKLTALLLERPVVDPRREFYKSTAGVNKGSRRSRLGGHGGNHFYAWWVPKSAPPLRDLQECYEALHKYAEAAEIHRSIGKSKGPLRHYRSIPDLDKALDLMRETGGDQTAAALEWLGELRQLLEKRPQNLLHTVSAAHKKFLTEMLEAQLDGVPVRRTTAKHTPRRPAIEKP